MFREAQGFSSGHTADFDQAGKWQLFLNQSSPPSKHPIISCRVLTQPRCPALIVTAIGGPLGAILTLREGSLRALQRQICSQVRTSEHEAETQLWEVNEVKKQGSPGQDT